MKPEHADYAEPDRPTNVRYAVVAVTAVAALWMYIDRVCFSTLSPNIGEELGIDEAEMAWVLGAFFFTYPLFQVPIGSLADRYGQRIVLTQRHQHDTVRALGAKELLHPLATPVGSGQAQHQMQVGLLQSGGRPHDHLGEERIREDRRILSRDDQGGRSRLAGGQSAGGRIGHVTELPDGPLDRLAFGAADVRCVVEGAGGHGAGDTGEFGHLVERRLPKRRIFCHEP